MAVGQFLPWFPDATVRVIADLARFPAATERTQAEFQLGYTSDPNSCGKTIPRWYSGHSRPRRCLESRINGDYEKRGEEDLLYGLDLPPGAFERTMPIVSEEIRIPRYDHDGAWDPAF
jgi:hypothetical protein